MGFEYWFALGCASVLLICILWAIFGHRVENFLDRVEEEVHTIDDFLSDVTRKDNDE